RFDNIAKRCRVLAIAEYKFGTLHQVVRDFFPILRCRNGDPRAVEFFVLGKRERRKRHQDDADRDDLSHCTSNRWRANAGILWSSQDEQLTVKRFPHSGVGWAYCSISGCSSNGIRNTPRSRSTSLKSRLIALSI